MKKVIFILAFMLIGTYVSANTLNSSTIDNEKTELIENNTDLKISIKTVIEVDICRVTVTVTRSDGRSFSATASNNRGNCDAAAQLAEDHARLLASVLTREVAEPGRISLEDLDDEPLKDVNFPSFN